MEIHEALFSIGLLIVFAKLLEGVFKRFGLNSIIAYAAAGLLLGPVGGLVKTGPGVEVILGIGIFVFFFLIGLEELDIRGFLAAIRGRLFLASVLSVAISLLVSLSVTTDILFDLGLGLDLTQALALAGVLSLSSLGVVAKVLIDEGRLRDPVGVQIFTAVVIAELMVLFVVGFAISEQFYCWRPRARLGLAQRRDNHRPDHRVHDRHLVRLHQDSPEGDSRPPPVPPGAATLLRSPLRRPVPRGSGG